LTETLDKIVAPQQYKKHKHVLLRSIQHDATQFNIARGNAFPECVWNDGCETWSPTLREEHRLKVFEGRMLRRIFGSKKDEVRGEWRKLHNEELRDL
jgi:hypothetical protein